MRASEVKENIGRPVVCEYNGFSYAGTLVAYTYRLKDNKIFHQAEISDRNHNSVVVVPLENTEVED